jgi:hypothetical protein
MGLPVSFVKRLLSEPKIGGIIMDLRSAELILRSLLERLDADAASTSPKYTSTVSATERQALRVVSNSLSKETTIASQTTTQNALKEALEPSEPSPETEYAPVKVTAPRHLEPVKLDLSSLDAGAYTSESQVVCLDFGTAKSKAFASLSQDATPDPSDLVELGLGLRDRDEDRAVYSINSSVWISDDGLMFAGSNALRQSTQITIGTTQRRRLDSIKQELSLSNFEKNLAQRALDRDVNPTSIPLSYEDAICFFLAYLTDLAGEELASQDHSRVYKRRFTLPCWRDNQRKWASAEIHRCLRRAQILADTFYSRWNDGIPVDEFKAAVTQAAQHENKLMHLMEDGRSEGAGILEPIAAGSGRVWADRSTRNLVLVVDVGAGTTDFSLFWVVQSGNDQRRAFPVQPCADAIRMAGDTIDDILIQKILSSTHGDLNETNKSRITADLRLRGIRRLKEQLFITGKVEVPLVTDQIVTIEREDFQNSPQIKALTSALEQRLSDFLSKVHPSWSKTPSGGLLVLTGGCAQLPFIQALSSRSWNVAGISTRFAQTRSVPEMIASNFDSDFQREYPQLAVAIGGALPLINEKSSLSEWQGGAASPGTLDRFAVTGQ